MNSIPFWKGFPEVFKISFKWAIPFTEKEQEYGNKKEKKMIWHGSCWILIILYKTSIPKGQEDKANVTVNERLPVFRRLCLHSCENISTLLVLPDRWRPFCEPASLKHSTRAILLYWDTKIAKPFWVYFIVWLFVMPGPQDDHLFWPFLL